MPRVFSVLILSMLFFVGCSAYKLGSNVPADCRDIAVPLFENSSGTPEINAFVTRAVLDEMLRDGTFTPMSLDSSTVKLLGSVTSLKWHSLRFDRSQNLQTKEYRLDIVARVTLVDSRTGVLILNEVPVKATTTFLTRNDLQTGMHDAMPRVSADLARNIVAMLNQAWPNAVQHDVTQLPAQQQAAEIKPATEQ